jgi:hypothetical protein
MIPLRYIGKEIERKAQEGEDISAIDRSRPIEYQPSQTKNTRAADPGLILRAKRLLNDGVVSQRRLKSLAKVSQHPFERFLNGARIHPATRTALESAIDRLEQQIANH